MATSLRLILVKRRLADEYDAAQERGEVAGHGSDRKINLPDVKVQDAGLTRKDIHEARIIRDAEATGARDGASARRPRPEGLNFIPGHVRVLGGPPPW